MSRSRTKTLIIMTNFGSIYRLLQSKYKESLLIIGAFFGEASCVSDMDMAILFSALRGTGMFNEVFALLGDPMQKTPTLKRKEITVFESV